MIPNQAALLILREILSFRIAQRIFGLTTVRDITQFTFNNLFNPFPLTKKNIYQKYFP